MPTIEVDDSTKKSLEQVKIEYEKLKDEIRKRF